MQKKLKGLLISFEGTEGAGKSTLMGELSKLLSFSQVPVITTREPGGSKLSEEIRSLILNQPMNSWTELFLYEAARSEHLEKVILPALERGKIVLCDRFTDSTLAYQGSARGLPWKSVQLLNSLATRGIRPDLTIWLDIDPKKGLERARVKNRFEQEGVEFQKKVRKGFLKAKKEDPKRWFVLKTDSGTPSELAHRVALQMKKRLKISFNGRLRNGKS